MPELFTIEIDGAGVGPAFREVKRQVLAQVLIRTHGNVLQAAAILGLHPGSMYRMVGELGLERFCQVHKKGDGHEDMDLVSDASHLPEPVG